MLKIKGYVMGINDMLKRLHTRDKCRAIETGVGSDTLGDVSIGITGTFKSYSIKLGKPSDKEAGI